VLSAVDLGVVSLVSVAPPTGESWTYSSYGLLMAWSSGQRNAPLEWYQ